MSRIGKKPISIPNSVTVTVDGLRVHVKGPKGELTRLMHPHVLLSQENAVLTVQVLDAQNQMDRALWGLTRQLMQNMIDGVTMGFQKTLELIGVGYKASVSGNTVTLHLGYSHPIDVPLPGGVSASVEKNKLKIEGTNKELVGNVAAAVRALRKPEPYKGKGVKYEGETIRRKVGKAAKAGA